MTYLKHEGLRAITPEFREAVQEWLAANAERAESKKPLANITSEEFIEVLEALGIGNNGAELARVLERETRACYPNERFVYYTKEWGRRRINDPSVMKPKDWRVLQAYSYKLIHEGWQTAKDEGYSENKQAEMVANAFDAIRAISDETSKERLEQAAEDEFECRWLVEAYISLSESSRSAIMGLMRSMVETQGKLDAATSEGSQETSEELLFADVYAKTGALSGLLTLIGSAGEDIPDKAVKATINQDDILREYVQ